MIIYNYINSLPDKLFSHQHIYHQDHYLHYSLLPLAHESCTFPAEIIAKTSSLHSLVDNYAILVQFTMISKNISIKMERNSPGQS